MDGNKNFKEEILTSKLFFAVLICIVAIFTLSTSVAVTAAATGIDEIELFVEPVSESEQPIITRNKSGSYDGFDYELWTQRSSDDISMTLTGGGTYQCEWDAENILFRTGKKLGSVMTYQEYGDVSLEYGAEHNITSGDVSYLTVYGWTEDPLVEFYIIENHGNYKPPGGVGFQGTYEMDGSTYEVYVSTREEKPSIQGTKTFQQYFGVRTDRRTEGTISISDHLKAWEEMGLDMSGKLYEISLCVEGYNSSGNADVYSHILTVGDTVYGSESDTLNGTTETAELKEPPAQIEEPSAKSVTLDGTVTDDPSNLPLLLGIGACVLAVGGALVVIVVKKGKQNR